MIDEDSITAVQSLIDEQAYPPTHTYDVRTLEPDRVLAERVELLLGVCPEFFQARKFLDIGASKGFFSLRAARESGEVVAVEPNKKALEIWAPLCPPNVKQVCDTFRGLSVREYGTFDMIWLGNGHHYVHREDPRGWLLRLALLASDRVVVEGPIGKEAAGFAGWSPGTVPEEKEWLEEAADYGLELLIREPSVSYTPGRALWHLHKTH